MFFCAITMLGILGMLEKYTPSPEYDLNQSLNTISGPTFKHHICGTLPDWMIEISSDEHSYIYVDETDCKLKSGVIIESRKCSPPNENGIGICTIRHSDKVMNFWIPKDYLIIPDDNNNPFDKTDARDTKDSTPTFKIRGVLET